MRTHRLLMLAIPLIGCYGPESVGPSNNNMMNCSADGGMRSDLSPAGLTCAAAKGLPGETLFCVDFANVKSLSDLQNWKFNIDCSQSQNVWTLANGSQNQPPLPAKNVLRIQTYSSYQDDCAFTTPLIVQNPAYTRLMISVKQRLEISSALVKGPPLAGPQLAQVYLNGKSTLLNQATGRSYANQLILSVDKVDLPPAVNGGHQFYISISAPFTAGTAFAGWEIDSIAINATKD